MDSGFMWNLKSVVSRPGKVMDMSITNILFSSRQAQKL